MVDLKNGLLKWLLDGLNVIKSNWEGLEREWFYFFIFCGLVLCYIHDMIRGLYEINYVNTQVKLINKCKNVIKSKKK